LKFGIEVQIETLGAIEELLITQQWAIRPDLLEEEGLPPARMRADEIRGKSPLLEIEGGGGTGLPTDHLGFELQRPGMDVGSAATAEAVAHESDSLRQGQGWLLDPQAHQGVAAHAGEGDKNVLVLTREALVNKQDPHGVRGVRAG
jgi:hypothetical protein